MYNFKLFGNKDFITDKNEKEGILLFNLSGGMKIKIDNTIIGLYPRNDIAIGTKIMVDMKKECFYIKDEITHPFYMLL